MPIQSQFSDGFVRNDRMIYPVPGSMIAAGTQGGGVWINRRSDELENSTSFGRGGGGGLNKRSGEGVRCTATMKLDASVADHARVQKRDSAVIGDW